MEPNTKLEEVLKQLISLEEAAKTSGMSASHLRLLVREQKIWGAKIGRNWFTTRAAVTEYLSQERHP